MSLYTKDIDIASIDQTLRFLTHLASCINVARQVSQTVSDDLIVYETTFLFKRIMHAAFGGIHYALGDRNATAFLWTTLDEDGLISERFHTLLRHPLFENSFRPTFTSRQIFMLLNGRLMIAERKHNYD
jgi:hypothetical protein